MLGARRLKRGLVLESMRLCHCFTSEPSVACVNATNQGRLLFACALKTEIGEQFYVAKRDICKRLGCCARIGCRHVCHAIMRDTFLDINWIKVRGGSRCFRATALIDGRSEEHTSELQSTMYLVC